MADPRDPDADRFRAMDALAKVEWMIETHGWALEAVAPSSQTSPPTPAQAYTIGVPALTGFPEIVVYGLTPAASHGLLSLVIDALRGGTEIPIGLELVGLLDNELRCVFAPIDLDAHAELLTVARAWYGDESFAAVQLLYPDRHGFMPYEPGFEHRLRLAQPVVGELTA